MDSIIYCLIWLAFILCVFFAWLFYNKARHEERKMLIERGIDPNELLKAGSRFRFPWLKIGIVIIGLSIGLGIIAILVNFGSTGHSDAVYPSILGLCGGTSLIIAHYVDRRKEQK